MISLAQTCEALAFDTPSAIPENWLQGRTAYGGLSAAMALHLVLKNSRPDLPPLKAAQIAFIGPVTASARFLPETLRQGKSVTQIGVDARVDGALAMRAAFVFGSARDSTIRHTRVERPDVGGPESYPQLAGPAAEIGHFKNFEVRFTGDAQPVSGAAEPEMTAWVRLRERGNLRPEVETLALGDFLPPASMAMFTTPAPISSVTWAVDFPRPATAPLTWCLQRSRSLNAGDGYSFQVMDMWDEAGNLLLLGTQTVAIFA